MKCFVPTIMPVKRFEYYHIDVHSCFGHGICGLAFSSRKFRKLQFLTSIMSSPSRKTGKEWKASFLFCPFQRVKNEYINLYKFVKVYK